MRNKLDKIYQKARKVEIDNNSKIIIMSDCHRGIGNQNDNFLENKYIFKKALQYYDKNKFTYIELGDGDEMWEVENYDKIVEKYPDIFQMLKKLNEENRLIMIYGNHDICKKNKNCTKQKSILNTFPIRQSIILEYNHCEIFLIHGHQVDFLNNTLLNVSKFTVRYVWRLLETMGIKDPTKPIKNHIITKKVEKKLDKWSHNHNKIVVAGHTHRPIYPKVGSSMYFNDGACVHPDGITCLEIENGKITLVKWFYKIKENKLTVERKIIKGNENIQNFYKEKNKFKKDP